MPSKNLSYFLSAICHNLVVVEISRKISETAINKTNRQLVKRLVLFLQNKKIWLAAMESCTGGALMSEITNVPGASNITQGGFITYSVAQKVAQGVSAVLIKKHSVCSPGTAVAMAYQVQQGIKGTDIGAGVTGVLAYGPKERLKNPTDRICLAVIYKNKLLVKELLLAPQSSRVVAKAVVVNQLLKDILEICS
jgi:nicotinamide-nucleotide amidase